MSDSDDEIPEWMRRREELLKPGDVGVPEAPSTSRARRLKAVARDLNDLNESTANFRAFDGLGLEQLRGIEQEARDNALADREKLAMAEQRIMAEGLIYTTQNALREYAQYLEKEDVQFIRLSIALGQRIIHVGTSKQLERFVSILERTSHALADDLQMTSSGGPHIDRRAALVIEAALLALDVDAHRMDDLLLARIEERLVSVEQLSGNRSSPWLARALRDLEDALWASLRSLGAPPS